MVEEDGPGFVQRGSRVQEPLGSEPFQRWALPDGTPWVEFHRRGEGYLLRFPELAEFELDRSASRIDGWNVPGVSNHTMEHLFSNQVLPLALSRRGRLVLHASTVDAAGRAVAFAGVSGRGKSTLAASFAAAGLPFLTDDGLQLRWRNDELLALPSHPSIRLWEDSQEFLARGSTLAPALDYTSKARVQAGPALAHCETPRPLARLYFIGEGNAEAIEIRPVQPTAGLMLLVEHSFLLDVAARELLAAHFDEIARIANLGLLYHLDYPRAYERLPEVRKSILNHLQSVA